MQSAENHPAQCCEVAEALAMQGQAVVSPQVKQERKKDGRGRGPMKLQAFHACKAWLQGVLQECRTISNPPFTPKKNPLSQKRF